MPSIIWGVFVLLVSAPSILAQVSPNPVADTEVRDSSSIRMRSIALERAKREANKPFSNKSSNEPAVNFSEIKEDFEKIQKLQLSIIKTYTTGEKINYEKISGFALEMTKKAHRLDENLFGLNSDQVANQAESKENKKQKSVKDLIIELDAALTSFVSSPIFHNTKLVDRKISEKSQMDLDKILKLSETLSKEAKKMK